MQQDRLGRPSRPIGVTVLAVVAILVALVSLAFGALLIGAGLIIGTFAGSQISRTLATTGYYNLGSLSVGTIALIVTISGAIFVVTGILYLAVGVGFFGGRGWSWTLGIIVSIISIIADMVQIAFGSFGIVLGLIISIMIVYYLTRPHVKVFFGKGSPMRVGPTSQRMTSMS